MIVFAKDITVRDHKHVVEERVSALKKYMEYQRKLFPYTVVRAGLDLAYKELDDIMNYVDNDHQPPPGSSRQEYPADVSSWYSQRFPWTSAFLKMDDTHYLLVVLIKVMDSFRTREAVNSYHLMVLYDCVHNIVVLYNKLLENSSEGARDINLSKGVPVNFDDFINNYWPHLDFMILSKPDYPHARHSERKQKIEAAFSKRLAEGEDLLDALGKIAEPFGLEKTAVALLRRDPPDRRDFELTSELLEGTYYDRLYKGTVEETRYGTMAVIDADYLKNLEYQATTPISPVQ